MFVVSQYILNLSGMCTTSQQITTYSIALGLILYGSVYLYILFYNNEYLNIFNKFIIYIVGVDLLLSAFYYYNLQSSDKLVKGNEVEDETESDSESEDDPEYEESEEDDDIDKEEDDNETQQYIQNLIRQANLSNQPLVPIVQLQQNESIPLLVEQQIQEQIPVFNQQEQELDLEHEQSEQPEPDQSEQQTETNVETDIDHIIEEVASKKKGGRKPRKTQATVV
jgi:hypothetical protein